MPSRDAVLSERLLTFGAAVRRTRHDLELSQEQLAETAGLHRTYIGGTERGERNVTLASAYAIADALKIPLSTLLEPTPDGPVG